MQGKFLGIIMIISFCVDFLLYMGTYYFLSVKPQYLRIIGASIIGALYITVCIRYAGIFSSAYFLLVSLIVKCIVAFAYQRDFLKKTVIYFMLFLALQNIVISLPEKDIFKGITGIVIIWLIHGLSEVRNNHAKPTVPILIEHNKRKLELNALIDTGNSLRDPVSGEYVMVISPDAAAKLTGLSKEQLLDPIGTLQKSCIRGLRLIPYNSVGNEGAMMLGLRISNVIIDGIRKNTLVALAPSGLNGYDALLGGEYDQTV